MTRREFTDKLLEKTGLAEKLTKGEMEQIFTATFDLLKSTVKSEKKFSIPKLGTFRLRSRDARKGRNPKTGETVKIKASKNIAFKPSTTLKDEMTA